MNRRKNRSPDKLAASKLIRAQGEQMRREKVDEYIKRKFEKSTFKNSPF